LRCTTRVSGEPGKFDHMIKNQRESENGRNEI
jgi:hypothetical protein